MKRSILIPAVALFVLAGAMTAFAYRVTLRETIDKVRRPELPTATPYIAVESGPNGQEPPPSSAKAPAVVSGIPSEIEPKNESSEASTGDADEKSLDQEVALPDSVNLAVPFTPQAPHADWSLPYQEACEESSLIMVNAWMVGTPSGLMEADVADRLIQELVAWQEERFGYYEDTSAEETAVIAREFYGYANSEVLPVESIEDVKKVLADGYAVILPAAGKKLGNPYFSGEGPLYHMLVVKGYTKDGRIITNDPGTKRGEDFLYDAETLFSAIGDWNDGNPADGEKLMIILKP